MEDGQARTTDADAYFARLAETLAIKDGQELSESIAVDVDFDGGGDEHDKGQGKGQGQGQGQGQSRARLVALTVARKAKFESVRTKMGCTRARNE